MSKVERITCITHGGNPIGLNNFYVAGDESIFRGIGHIAICKRCIFELVESYYEQYGKNMRLAIYYTCRKIDVGFDDNVLEGSISSSLSTGNKEVTPTRVIQSYMRQVNSLGRINDSQLSFDKGHHIDYEEVDSEKAKDDNTKEEIIIMDVEITSEIREFWGEGLEDSEYAFLVNELYEYINAYECDTPVMEKLLQQAAYESLEIRRRRVNREPVDKNLKNLQDLLGSANVKPVQETGANASDQATFGTLIKKWENEEPIPEPLGRWKDSNWIVKYMRTWFFGHLTKITGNENPYQEEYEEEMNRYKVDALEDGDDDGES